MDDLEKLEALVAQIKAAEGPSQELDVQIWNVLFPADFAIAQCMGAASITGSTEAALALVETVMPGAKWSISNHQKLQPRPVQVVLWPAQEGGCQIVEAATLPLAIVAALLAAILFESRDA